MLKNINCDYIIRYIDSFKETHYSVIITEYCENGDLKKLINEYKSLNKLIPDELLTDYFNQLINGLCYLHQNNIMHRDVKPENIFVLEKNQLKYGDLGISRMATSSRKLTQLVGSTNYMSPEVVNEKDYDCKCDVW
jgi:serine/threonine protein kinase